MPILALIIYHFAFFRQFYCNPNVICTSELASTYFPHWIWMGRELREGRFPAIDDIYYKMPGSISFLSTFYPINILTSYIGSWLRFDWAWNLYAHTIIIHRLIGSIVAYLLFVHWCSAPVSLFGAITYSYCAYNIKPYTPEHMFLTAWVPAIFLSPAVGIIATSLCLTAGYFPIFVYLFPFFALMHPINAAGGLLLAMPQLIPFFEYWKLSIRNDVLKDCKYGRFPVHKLIDFLLPTQTRDTTNGIIFPEMAVYMGFLPFCFIWFSHSRFWIVLAIGLLIAMGRLPQIMHISSRALFACCLSITILATDGLSKLHLPFHLQLLILLSQSILILSNRQYLNIFPFQQWWKSPLNMYKQKVKSHSWPYNTGYLIGERISEYQGAFRLK